MIQIEWIRIKELRGIRELEIEPNRRNFIVSGPNGSGKSGVVDAIQFALTGEMSRLSGKGTGGLSVHRHGPHVDSRGDPAAAQVSLRLYLPDLAKSVVLTRSVGTAKTFRLEQDDPEIRALVEEVAQHPEFSLSRREIIKYILVEAGQRSKEIQALLQLEEIGEVRGVLKTVRNRLSIALRTKQQEAEDASDALRRHLDTTDLSKDNVLAAVNPRRQTLGLPEILDLAPDTDLSAGVLGGGQTGFSTTSALQDMEALLQAVAEYQGSGHEAAPRLLEDLVTLESDPVLQEAVTRRSFVERGLGLVDGKHCPLCDSEWHDEGALKAHLRAKLEEADQAEALQERILDNGSRVAAQARHLAKLVEAIQTLAIAAIFRSSPWRPITEESRSPRSYEKSPR